MSRLEFLSLVKYKYTRLSKFVNNMATHYVAIPHQKNGTIMAFSDLYVFSRTVWRFLPASHYSTAPKYHIENKLRKNIEINKYTCWK